MMVHKEERRNELVEPEGIFRVVKLFCMIL